MLFVLAVGIPLSGILAWSINSQFNNELGDAESHASSMAYGVAENAEAVLNETYGILSALAKRPGVQAMDGRNCDPFLTGLRKALPQYANFNVMNRRWEFVCSAVYHDPAVIIPTSYPEVYKKMIAADDMVLSPPILGQLTHKWVVFAAYPVKDSTKKLLGAVTAPINLTALARNVSGNSQPDSTTIKITNSDGIIVTSYPNTELIGKHEPATSTVNETVNSDRTYIKTDVDGVERIYASRPVAGSDWTVLIGMPTDVVLGSFRHERNVVLIALIHNAGACGISCISDLAKNSWAHS